MLMILKQVVGAEECAVNLREVERGVELTNCLELQMCPSELV